MAADSAPEETAVEHPLPSARRLAAGRDAAGIAAENNLSETACLVPEGEGWEIRWFTPVAEADLCGHATLASAGVVFPHLAPDLGRIAADYDFHLGVTAPGTGDDAEVVFASRFFAPGRSARGILPALGAGAPRRPSE